MARPRKPTNVLDLTGALAKNPARYADRANEPKISDPLGPPPDTFQPAVRAAWMELDRLAPWLCSADRIGVEVVAQLLSVFRTLGPIGTPSHIVARLDSMLTRLGYMPTDRSKITMPEVKGANKFANNGAKAAR